MKLSEVASKLGCRLEGDGDAEIRGVAGIEVAASGELTFLANRRYAPQLKSTRASAVFIEERVVLNREEGAPPLKPWNFFTNRRVMRREFIRRR
jgi:UDP-3-O-[3-hydroxymyristoyl] glucosamine N-acyltransferase